MLKNTASKSSIDMAVQSVAKMGDAQLAKASLAVTDFSTASLRALVADMQDTMKAKGGVGIAAPQIGVNQRVIMFGFTSSERYPNEKPIPFTVLVNPIIETIGDEMIDGWEGCLSVPGLRGLVPRYRKIKYSGFDTEGSEIIREAEGFHARILQHECDHLDGVLYPERIKDMRRFGFEDALSADVFRQSSDAI